MTRDSSEHIPVMLKEVIEYLKPQEGQVFVDATLGLGGHAKAILCHRRRQPEREVRGRLAGRKHHSFDARRASMLCALAAG